jgi:hypothetical protein
MNAATEDVLTSFIYTSIIGTEIKTLCLLQYKVTDVFWDMTLCRYGEKVRFTPCNRPRGGVEV